MPRNVGIRSNDVSVPEKVLEKKGRCRDFVPARRDREEVNEESMRKNMALVALLALTLALAAVGCTKKTEETTPPTTTTTTDTTSMTQDTTTMAPDTTQK
jgi:hypothetical protein